MGKNSVVIGASPNFERYSYKATVRLNQYGHKVYPIGLRSGKIEGIDIITDKPQIPNVDTVTLYVGPQNQEAWKEYIFSLKPKRIIFNPGTENPEFQNQVQSKGIECVEACTLVMLSVGNY
ncbi:MAG: CoA-binding protein [Bacteroidetes bacterium]|nr:CoA-binding protein [Bacteroidota bacterium]